MSLHGTLCSIIFNLICNMTIFSQTNVLTFGPHLEVEGVCKDREYVFTWYSVFHYI